jgi:hypothetical protein
MSTDKTQRKRDLTYFLDLLKLSGNRVKYIRAGGTDVEREVLFLLEMLQLHWSWRSKAWHEDEVRVLRETHAEEREGDLDEIVKLRLRPVKAYQELQELKGEFGELRSWVGSLGFAADDLTRRMKTHLAQDLSTMRQSAMTDAERGGRARLPIPTLYEEAIRSLELLRSAVKNPARVNQAGRSVVRESVKALARKVDAMGTLVYKNRMDLKQPATRRRKRAGKV